MKHNIYILLTIATTLLPFMGCNSFLDQAPNNEEDEDYIFQDYERSRRYMDELYSNLPALWSKGSTIGVNGYGFMESATDMAEYTANYGTANTTFNVGNWKSAYDEVLGVWAGSYRQIRRCYKTLEKMDSFNNEPRDDNGESRKETMKGEVHFMLGFYYFELLKRYGGVPLVTGSLTLDANLKVPRSSYDEVSEFIVKQLDSAATLLPDQWPEGDFGRVTKTAAMAFKSRVLLYAASPLNNPDNDKAKWEKAAKAARDVIDHCEQTKLHSLYKKQYQDLFFAIYPEKIPEIIMPKLEGQGLISFNSTVILYGQAVPTGDFGGYGNNSPTQNYVDRFEIVKYDGAGNAVGTEKFDWNNPEHVRNIYKNRDPRFYYSVIYNNMFWIKRKIETWRDGKDYGKDRNPKDHLFTRTGYYLRKFWPKECMSAEQEGSSRIIAFYIRYAEVLLNYAEAMNEVYGPDNDGLGRGTSITARDAINQIRARLVCPPSDQISDSQDDPYYKIKEERKWNPDFPVLPNGMPNIPKGLSLQDMRERIINERIIELAFEDQYFYDALRWKRGPEMIGGSIYGVDAIKKGNQFEYKRIEVEKRVFDPNRMYHYPVPLYDTYSMGIDQNPGW